MTDAATVPVAHNRRRLLGAGASLLASGGWVAGSAHAQAAGNVVELMGPVWCNDEPLTPQRAVQTGDWLRTAAGGHLVIQIGDAALLLRQNTHLQIERGASLNTVGAVRLESGAVTVAWQARGATALRQVVTAHGLALTSHGASVVHVEAPPQGLAGSYACVCFGWGRVYANGQHVDMQSLWHLGVQVDPDGQLQRAPRHDHTDDEARYLAALVGLRTPWGPRS